VNRFSFILIRKTFVQKLATGSFAKSIREVPGNKIFMELAVRQL